MDSNEDSSNVTVRRKKQCKRVKISRKDQLASEDSDMDVIPPSQNASHKTSRWNREKMKKVGIAKPKGKNYCNRNKKKYYC